MIHHIRYLKKLELVDLTNVQTEEQHVQVETKNASYQGVKKSFLIFICNLQLFCYQFKAIKDQKIRFEDCCEHT